MSGLPVSTDVEIEALVDASSVAPAKMSSRRCVVGVLIGVALLGVGFVPFHALMRADLGGVESAYGSVRKYKRTQMLGFSLFTFPTLMNEVDGKTYTGISDLKQDVEGRIKIMKAAMDTAYASANSDPNILKVFVAPEFFFRGPQGAYEANSLYNCPQNDKSCYNPINEIGRHLEKLAEDEKWSDWLFVFGTVLAAEADPSATKTGRLLKDLEASDARLFYNFAPIYKGASDQRWLLTKYYFSGIDFLDSSQGEVSKSNIIDMNGQKPDLYTKVPEIAKQWLNSVSYNVVENNVLSVDGLTIGVEICLDHLAATLAKNKGRTPVDLQIITSAGMSLQKKSIVAPAVFLQDGGVMSRTEFTSMDFVGKDNYPPACGKEMETGISTPSSWGKAKLKPPGCFTLGKIDNGVPAWPVDDVWKTVDGWPRPSDDVSKMWSELFALDETVNVRGGLRETFTDNFGTFPKVIASPVLPLGQ